MTRTMKSFLDMSPIYLSRIQKLISKKNIFNKTGIFSVCTVCDLYLYQFYNTIKHKKHLLNAR